MIPPSFCDIYIGYVNWYYNCLVEWLLSWLTDWRTYCLMAGGLTGAFITNTWIKLTYILRKQKDIPYPFSLITIYVIN